MNTKTSEHRAHCPVCDYIVDMELDKVASSYDLLLEHIKTSHPNYYDVWLRNIRHWPRLTQIDTLTIL